MSRIDIGNNMRQPQTVAASAEGFYAYAGDQLTGTMCANLLDALEQKRREELTEEEYKQKKRELKIDAHFYTPHAHFEKHYKSCEGEPVDSGKAIIDVDGCEHFPELYSERLMGREKELGINMVNRSVSGTGGHVLFDIPEGLTRQQAQKWMAHELGDVDYDGAVHELERGIFIPCREYILYIDEELMFGDELRPAVLAADELELWQGRTQGSDPVGRTQGTVPAVTASPSHQGQSPCATPCAPSARAMAAFDETLKMTGIDEVTLNRDGVRHNTLKLLLPTLCQMMPQEELLGVLARRMPDYSKEKDCQELVANFYEKYVDPYRPLNLKQKEVFLKSLQVTEGDGTEGESASQLPVFRVNAKSLPIGLKESLKGNPENIHLPLIVGVMPVLMALASDVEVRYIDGRRQYLGGMAIIKADQANNKSAIEAAVDLWMEPIRKEDELARQREEDISAKNKGRKNNERAEPEPKMLVREVPITISCSRLLKRLKIAKGKTLYSFCPEMDTLVKSNSAGNWSAKYDIYRVAFDRGRWGQDYNSDQAESGMARVAYNWTILSTPGSLRKCFRGDNIENGLSGRMMLAELPDDPYAKVTVFQESSQDDVTRIEQAVAILRSCSGFYDTPKLRRAIDNWVEQKRQEAALALDRVKAVYRKRAAVIGFRCGVVFMLLAGKESKACIEFALTLAEYTLQMQMKNFGPALNHQFVKASEDGGRYRTNHVIFDELPSSFVFADLRARKGTEFSESTLYSIIHRWTKEGWITKEGKIFKKVRTS